MLQKTTPEERRNFYRLHLQGVTYLEIAEGAGVSHGCVRYWCRRQRDGGSPHSRYRRAEAGKLSRFDPKVGYCVLKLRLKHPGWGPNRILMRLRKRSSLDGLALPSESSIGRYLHQWEKFCRRAKQIQEHERLKQAERVHQRWQIDFKLEIPLSNGMLVNLMTVRDPMGEACIGAYVFPAGEVGKRGKRVNFEQVRSALRHCFIQWGTLPEEIQSDNESLFVGKPQDNFPSRFALWLTGLGITHLVIRPGKPTDNAEVERCHRIIMDYAVIGNQEVDLVQLQSILGAAVYELCYELPSRAEGCAGLPPVQAHPELLQPRRPYLLEHEIALFDLKAVDAHLAEFTWERKVGKTGQITFGHHKAYSVGRAYAGEHVLVRFDPADRHFVFFKQVDDQEIEIGRRPARDLEKEDLTGLGSWPIGLRTSQLPLPLSFSEGVNC